MTLHPQQHCDHECVCMGYANRSEMFEDGVCTKLVCSHDTRRQAPTPITPTRINEISPVYPEEWLKQHDATIRNQTLDEAIEHFKEVMHYHPLGVTIKTLNLLKFSGRKSK